MLFRYYSVSQFDVEIRMILTILIGSSTVYRLCSGDDFTSLGECFAPSRRIGLCYRSGYRDLFCKAALSADWLVGNDIPARGPLSSIDGLLVASLALEALMDRWHFYHQVRHSTRFYEPVVLHVLADHPIWHRSSN